MTRFLMAAAAAALFALPVAAEIKAMKPFVYATTPSQKAGGAFITLHMTEGEDRLLSAASAAAKRVEIHTHINDDGVMKMRQVEGPLPLTPETPIVMAPGGVHVMLMGLNAQLVAGEAIDVTLGFEKAGEITVSVPIIARGHGGHSGHGTKTHNHGDG